MSDYRVEVLWPGYAVEERPGAQRADGTVTLVRGALTILVDTGGPWDRERLLDALTRADVGPAEVDVVVCTHGHSDHVGNLNVFPEAELIVSHDRSRGDLYSAEPFGEGTPYVIDDHVEVIATPGHTAQDISVVVRTDEGVYVIAGDLFECAADLHDERLWQATSEDPETQAASRARVLEMADFIVPGHGDVFRVR